MAELPGAGRSAAGRNSDLRGWVTLQQVPVDVLGHGELNPTVRRLNMQRWAVTIAVVDAVLCAAVVLLALAARFGNTTATSGGFHLGLLPLVAAPAWTVAMWIGGSYDIRVLPSGTEEYRRVVNASLWVLGLVGLVAFAFQANVSRVFVAIAFPGVVAASLIGRWLARLVLRRRLSRGSTVHRTVVIGGPEEATSLIRHMRQASHLGYSVVRAYVPTEQWIRQPDDGARAITPEALIEQLRILSADTIAVAHAASFGPGALRRLSWSLEGTGVTLLVAPPLADIAGPRIVVRPAQGLPLLEIEEPEFHGAKRIMKDVIDRAAATLLLALAAPVLMTIIVLIKAADRGPAFFRQERVGRVGCAFRIWKFRTMSPDAEARHPDLLHASAHDGLLFKLANDPRVTPIGRYLRRYSLDELPQLINVISGSMSLVGPRPQRPAEVALYADDHRRRLLVKPGMTGLWQISGRNSLSWEEAVQLDLYYIDNWSITLDFIILAKTIWAVIRSSGAY